MSMRIKLGILLTVLFLAAIGNTIFTFVLEDYGEEKLRWVIHTHEVITDSERLLGSMTDAETGQRGYLLTKDLAYLEPYHAGLASSKKHFNELVRLTSDNPNQQKRLVTINALMQQKFKELELTISLTQENNPEASREASNIVSNNSGKKYMDAIRGELVSFNNEERILLEKRKGDFRENRAYIMTMVGVEILFFLFMAIITVLFIKNKLYSPLGLLLESTSKMEKGEKQKISDILPNDEMGYLLSSFYQMSEKVYANTEKLAYEAAHDVLTGLNNRTGLNKKITDSIAELADNNSKMAVFFIDLNKFKYLNDTLGHDAGDAILKETAKRLKDAVRSDDVVFRLGGDEFVVVIKNVAQTSYVKKIVHCIIESFTPSFIFNGKSLEISLSIGIVISPDDSTNSEEILRFSDIAMYAAKHDKDTGYKFFDKTMLRRDHDG